MATSSPVGIILVYDTYRRMGPAGTKLFHGLVRARKTDGSPSKQILWECDRNHDTKFDARKCSFAKCKANAHRWRWYISF